MLNKIRFVPLVIAVTNVVTTTSDSQKGKALNVAHNKLSSNNLHMPKEGDYNRTDVAVAEKVSHMRVVLVGTDRVSHRRVVSVGVGTLVLSTVGAIACCVLIYLLVRSRRTTRVEFRNRQLNEMYGPPPEYRDPAPLYSSIAEKLEVGFQKKRHTAFPDAHLIRKIYLKVEDKWVDTPMSEIMRMSEKRSPEPYRPRSRLELSHRRRLNRLWQNVEDGTEEQPSTSTEPTTNEALSTSIIPPLNSVPEIPSQYLELTKHLTALAELTSQILDTVNTTFALNPTTRTVVVRDPIVFKERPIHKNTNQDQSQTTNNTEEDNTQLVVEVESERRTIKRKIYREEELEIESEEEQEEPSRQVIRNKDRVTDSEPENESDDQITLELIHSVTSLARFQVDRKSCEDALKKKRRY